MKKYYLIILVVFILFFPQNYVLAKLIYLDFDDCVKKSDFILIGTVVKVNKNLFSEDIATLKINNEIYGSCDDKFIKIKFGPYSIFYAKEDFTEFSLGKKYILLLRKDDKYYSLVGAHRGYFQIRDKQIVSFENKSINLSDFIEKIESIKLSSNQQ